MLPIDNTLLVLATTAGLHYAASAYVAYRSKHIYKTNEVGEKLTAVGYVSSLHIYPVKSVRRMETTSAMCSHIGPFLPKYNLFDRHFILINGKGVRATMMKYPRMALISPRIWNGKLHLDAPGMRTLTLPCNIEKTDSSILHAVEFRKHSQKVYGIECAEEANDWFSTFLGKHNMKLLYFADKVPAKNGYLSPYNLDLPDSAQLSFADVCPYNILGEASVDLLNRHLEKPVSVYNFRPNIVVSGSLPNAEDQWYKVHIGNAVFRCITRDPRCIITTVDPNTGVMDKTMEPIRTMKSIRPKTSLDENAPAMGVYMILEKAGEIKVGNTVYASITNSS